MQGLQKRYVFKRATREIAQHDIQQWTCLCLYAWSNACHISYVCRERAKVLFLPNEVHLSVRRPSPPARGRPRSVSSFNIAFYRILKARREYASCSEHRPDGGLVSNEKELEGIDCRLRELGPKITAETSRIRL